MMKNKLIATTLLTTLCFSPVFADPIAPASTTPLPSSLTPSIEVYVNNKIITSYDVESRLKLLVLLSGVKDTPQIRKKILETLIDEELQLQEMEKFNISIPEEHLVMAVASVAERSNIPPAQFDQFLKDRGIPKSTLERQLKTQAGWWTQFRRHFEAMSQVSDERIAQIAQHQKEQTQKTQYRMFEIVLNVSSPLMEESVQQQIQDLSQQLQATPQDHRMEKFAVLAQQLSNGASARFGGDMGLLDIETLEPNVQGLLSSLQPGMLSGPVRTASGYSLFLMMGKKMPGEKLPEHMVYGLKQMFIPKALFNTDPTLIFRLNGIRTAEAFDQFAASNPEISVKVRPQARAIEMTPQLNSLLQHTPDNTPTQPIDIGSSILVLMITDRKDTGGVMSEQDIKEKLVQENIMRMAISRLHDLRAQSYIKYTKPSTGSHRP